MAIDSSAGVVNAAASASVVAPPPSVASVSVTGSKRRRSAQRQPTPSVASARHSNTASATAAVPPVAYFQGKFSDREAQVFDEILLSVRRPNGDIFGAALFEAWSSRCNVDPDLRARSVGNLKNRAELRKKQLKLSPASCFDSSVPSSAARVMGSNPAASADSTISREGTCGGEVLHSFDAFMTFILSMLPLYSCRKCVSYG
jgi:hypothetical protein